MIAPLAGGKSVGSSLKDPDTIADDKIEGEKGGIAAKVFVGAGGYTAVGELSLLP